MPRVPALYEEDPAAWREFGYHAEGEANWQRGLDRIAFDAARGPLTRETNDEIPF